MGTEKNYISSKNHTQAPGGLTPPKTCQTTAKTLWKIGLQNQTVRREHWDTALMNDLLSSSAMGTIIGDVSPGCNTSSK